MGVNDNSITEEQRVDFGRALARAMRQRLFSQADVARVAGTTQTSVSGWISGKYAPSPRSVFAVEEALRIPPGSLSQHLGYYPRSALNHRFQGLDAALIFSEEFSETEKRALMAMVETFRSYRAERDRASTTAADRLQAFLDDEPPEPEPAVKPPAKKQARLDVGSNGG